MLRSLPTLILAVLLAVAPLAPGARAEESPALPRDPSLVHGRLENGLQYVLKRHANPEKRISLWLHVSTGSLNETEEQRGIAHYLEHMAFNGSKNFAPGTVVHYFESLGLSFGRDQNAFTGLDQTTYQLALPNCERETIEKGLLFLSDVGMRLSLLPAEIESERQIILEEKRTRAGAAQRVQDYILERMLPESILGRRMPIGTEETIKSVQEKDFRAYYGAWYVPSNMTVLAVGDCDMAPVAEAITKSFGDGPMRPQPAPQAVGVVPSASTRAIVATDPELTAAEISLTRVDAARPPATTLADFRRDLVEAMGPWIFNRRMRARLAEGKVAFQEAGASTSEMAHVLREVSMDVGSAPGTWRAALEDGVRGLQQARAFGFSEEEVADARKALVAQAEQRLRAEATLPARAILFRLNGAVASGEPVLSAEQSRDLTARLLPTIKAAEVSAAFRADFDFTHVTFVAKMPAGPGVPTEAQLIEAGRKALALPAEKPAEEQRAKALLASVPVAGRLAEAGEHAASGVWSAWCENGVRVHHLFNAQRRNDVSITITLAGGEIEESAANRGVTDAAVLAWSQPASSKLTSTQVRDLMTGKNIRVSGGASHDTLSLTVSGEPSDLEAGLQLAYLLLTEPVVEASALAQWKDGERQRIQAERMQPMGVLQEAIAAALFPGTASMKPLQEADLEAVTREAAEAWLRGLVRRAPIEVAVVGDLERTRAEALLATYLGSLPARPRIGPDTLTALRKLARPKGPLHVGRTVSTKTPQAFVLDGFFGVDRLNLGDLRPLNLASRILSTRMITTIREEKQLVYSIGASSQPSGAYPGFGMFVAQAPADPARAQALGVALEELYEAFKASGPTADEMKVAHKQVANTLDEAMKTPAFWMQQISELDYRGRRLDDLVALPAAYQAITAKDVQGVFARYCVPEGRFRFVIVPAAATAPR